MKLLLFLLFLIYILMIVAVIFVERKTPTEALLWVLILICMPYLGALLYLIFGSTLNIKLTAYTRKKRLHNQALHIPMMTMGAVDNFDISDEDRQVMQFNARYNQGAVTCYDEAQVYISGETQGYGQGHGTHRSHSAPNHCAQSKSLPVCGWWG